MPNRSVIFACIVFLGSAGTSMAAPKDEPGTVYIGGSPCNRACRSYIAWSRKVSSELALRLTKAFSPHATARHAHVAKPPVETARRENRDHARAGLRGRPESVHGIARHQHNFTRPGLLNPLPIPILHERALRTHVPSIQLLSVPVQEPRRNT